MLPICHSIFSSSRQNIPKKRRSFDLSLYLVANRSSYPDENLFFSKIKDSVKGGVTCVQLRDHKSDFNTVLKTARHLKNMLKGIPLFINTLKPFEIAQAVHAEGIYAEEPFSYTEARRLLGEKAIIGIPVKTTDDVVAASQMLEVDYLSVKVSPSKRTCPRNDNLWGLEGLETIRRITPHRLVAIGGLNLECVEPVYKILHFDDGIAMAGGLMEEDDPFMTAQKIQAIRRKLRGGL